MNEVFFDHVDIAPENIHLPQADEQADIQVVLSDAIWRKKLDIITDTYGFAPDSWEARTTPQQEAFWTSAHC